MYLILKLFILLLFPSLALSAKNQLAFQPFQRGHVAGYFLAGSSYKDLRVLTPDRRSIAYWMVEKDQIKMEYFFERGKLSELRVRKAEASAVLEIIYVSKNGNLKLMSALKRPARIMAGTLLKIDKTEVMCKMKTGFESDLKSVSRDLSASTCRKNLAEKIIDPECHQILTPEQYKLLQNAYVRNLMMPESENEFLECLKSPETRDIFAKGYGIADPSLLKTQFDIIDMKFRLNSNQFYNTPEEVAKKVTCKESPDGKFSATTTEDGVTTFYWGKSVTSAVSEDDVFQVVSHENVHKSDVVNEVTTSNLIKVCFEGAGEVTTGNALVSVKRLEFQQEAKTKGEGGAFAPNLLDATKTAARDVASNTPVKITNQDARAGLPPTIPMSDLKMPSPTTLTNTTFASANAVTNTASGVSPQFVSTVYREGEGALSKGRNLAALAAKGAISPAYAAPLAVRSAVPTGPAESSKALRNIASAASSVSGPAEKVPSANQNENLANLASATANPSVNSEPGTDEGQSRELAKSARNTGSGSSSGGGGGSLRGPATQRSSGSVASKASPKQRVPASASDNSAAKIVFMKQLEKPELYRKNKAKMDRGEFNSDFDAFGIKVIDLSGKETGASNASTIYMDNGSKFVYQGKGK